LFHIRVILTNSLVACDGSPIARHSTIRSNVGSKTFFISSESKQSTMLEDDFTPKVAPDSATPKVIGTLNIIFGLGLLACSLCYGFYALSLAMVGVAAQMGRTEVTQRIDALKTELQNSEAKLVVTQDEAERDSLKSQIESLQSQIQDAQEGLEGFDAMDGVGFNDPRYVVHFSADVISSWVLNILLLVSGAGLLGLREWARKLCIGVCWAKILRLALLALSGLLVVAPILSDMLDRTIKSAAAIDARAEAEIAQAKAARSAMIKAASDAEQDAAFQHAVQDVVDQARGETVENPPGRQAERDARVPREEPDHPAQPAKSEIHQELVEAVADARDELKAAAGELEQIAGAPPVPPPAPKGPIVVQVDAAERAQIQQASRMIGVIFGAYSIGMLVIGSIYPVLCIILLNRPAVKTAFEIQKRMRPY
jgi:hypothetical protein